MPFVCLSSWLSFPLWFHWSNSFLNRCQQIIWMLSWSDCSFKFCHGMRQWDCANVSLDCNTDLDAVSGDFLHHFTTNAVTHSGRRETCPTFLYVAFLHQHPADEEREILLANMLSTDWSDWLWCTACVLREWQCTFSCTRSTYQQHMIMMWKERERKSEGESRGDPIDCRCALEQRKV